MIITVHAKAGSKHEWIEKRDDGTYRVCVNAPAVEGKANAAIAAALAKYFSVAKSKVTLLHGSKGKLKRFEIAKEKP